MASCVEAFNALTGKNLSALDGWIFMLCLKIARSRHGKFHKDDYTDMAGYSALAAEEAEAMDSANLDGMYYEKH
jgi:hypothetical protein